VYVVVAAVLVVILVLNMRAKAEQRLLSALHEQDRLKQKLTEYESLAPKGVTLHEHIDSLRRAARNNIGRPKP